MIVFDYWKQSANRYAFFQVQFQLPLGELIIDLKVVFDNRFRLAELTPIAKLI